MLTDETEILAARRSFPDGQVLLNTGTQRRQSGLYSCGWYDQAISAERGSFALVNRGGRLEEHVGDRLRLKCGDKSIIVYVLATEDLDYEIHVTRRAFAAVQLLAVDRIDVTLEVLVG